jgi:hypothetical protein
VAICWPKSPGSRSARPTAGAPEYQARGQAVAELCPMAGADEALIPQWIREGRRRAEVAQLPPFSQPGRAPRRP